LWLETLAKGSWRRRVSEALSQDLSKAGSSSANFLSRLYSSP
jgi:hypothetical protein